MTFTSWLKKQRGRNHPIADLANDVKTDDTWPKHAKKYYDFKHYLLNCQASSKCMEVFEEAWKEYGGKMPTECLGEDCEIPECKIRCKAAYEEDGYGGPVKRSDYADIYPSLRFIVMKRDGFKCRLCGRDASDGVKLEVDHITPVANKGKTVEENLWTLCFDCNRGKGTRALQ